ncbi:PREDICTED: putative UDP-GlcNAc:betaGal beta-1,3-N-acetylglucosaminyltransferase LOC100288842 [Thamnophis sirtalis]|uniref:Hexosyltransferase n=1 Tax=Thamnophis sirtalis TaxID=35019 RepID=A0A6I9YTZ0_9SAUR|nr:PREDICTED: putative UDP-GlcNAc:betaGal beta-1,3-N-acetylglucosaminyltransferase LOC100288842 [Thamnophis sirtalis]
MLKETSTNFCSSPFQQLIFCRLRTHQWCFMLFNVALFHILLFGADLAEEYFLQAIPTTYMDAKVLRAREKARILDMSSMKTNISQAYVLSNPEACSNREVFLLVLIFSSPQNLDRRSAIRKTWANVTHVQGYTTLVLFVLGKPSSATTQVEVIKESDQQQDLIQGIFLDTPENQTMKVKRAVEWTVTFCPKARFVFKVDEEMFANLQSLVEYLLNLRAHPEDIYLGRVIHPNVPNKEFHNGSFTSVRKHPGEYYPDYCSATALVISQDVARKIYVTSREVPPSLPPGLFMSVCARAAGVVPIHSSRFSGGRRIWYNRCCYKYIFTSTVSETRQLLREWKEMKGNEDCTLLETYYGLVSCKIMTYLDGLKESKVKAVQNEHFSN